MLYTFWKKNQVFILFVLILGTTQTHLLTSGIILRSIEKNLVLVVFQYTPWYCAALNPNPFCKYSILFRTIIYIYIYCHIFSLVWYHYSIIFVIYSFWYHYTVIVRSIEKSLVLVVFQYTPWYSVALNPNPF